MDKVEQQIVAYNKYTTEEYTSVKRDNDNYAWAINRFGKSKYLAYEAIVVAEKQDKPSEELDNKAVGVVRIDIKGFEDSPKLIQYLLETDQFAGARYSGDDNYLDILGFQLPTKEKKKVLSWMKYWNKIPLILRRRT